MRDNLSLLRSTLDAIDGQIAVINKQGLIVLTNKAWLESALQNVATGIFAGVGLDDNYLEVCKNSWLQGNDTAGRALNGIIGVIDGRLPGFELEYPCNSATLKLWFMMSVLKIPAAEDHFLLLHRDITNKKSASLDLVAALQSLRSVNKEMEEFVYIVSHDLQEPLRMVSCFLNLIELEIGSELSVDIKSYIHFAVDGADRMKSQIEALVRYSRIGRQEDHFEPVDLEEIIDYVKKVLHDEIQTTEAIIQTNKLPVIMAIKALIPQLFLNLIGNALKYKGPNPPVIEIACRSSDLEWHFSVKDNGIGIRQEFHKKIFIIFQRAHARDEYPGTGTGLAVCKKIVNKHGGEIWVESVPGQGSTFHFSINKSQH